MSVMHVDRVRRLTCCRAAPIKEDRTSPHLVHQQLSSSHSAQTTSDKLMEPNPSRSVAFKTLCSSAEKPNRVVEFRTIDVPENVVAKTLAEPYLPSPTPLHPVRLHFLDGLVACGTHANPRGVV